MVITITIATQIRSVVTNVPSTILWKQICLSPKPLFTHAMHQIPKVSTVIATEEALASKTQKIRLDIIIMVLPVNTKSTLRSRSISKLISTRGEMILGHLLRHYLKTENQLL
jgi:hypothetical protein